MISQLEAAFPEYAIVSSTVLYPYHRYPIDPSIRISQASFQPYSPKVIQIFRAYPNISFEADEASTKNFIQQTMNGADLNFESKQPNTTPTTSNPYLRRVSVSSCGGLVDFSRRRLDKRLESTSTDPLKQFNLESNETSIVNEFLTSTVDLTEEQHIHQENLSAWEAYSFCESFLIHTELSDALDEINKDDCICTVTLVVQTSPESSYRNNQNSAKDDALDNLLKNINSLTPFRLCLVSTVYIFPSFLSHAYSILRQHQRIVLHCYELLQHLVRMDHGDSSHNDLCDSSTILKYVTSAIFGLVVNETQGQRTFGIANSAALVS